ncbi:uncharacterized protein LOC110118031 [Ceratitis capitata]|uniref:uncharacterized protein LOC110118031 n=1 Tax=Ceratitis capitata TaxID=7213 RepID=UPI000A0F5BEB|nr:uncharacterized protein LOC110118031 [Ceratitis capitata]
MEEKSQKYQTQICIIFRKIVKQVHLKYVANANPSLQYFVLLTPLSLLKTKWYEVSLHHLAILESRLEILSQHDKGQLDLQTERVFIENPHLYGRVDHGDKWNDIDEDTLRTFISVFILSNVCR